MRVQSSVRWHRGGGAGMARALVILQVLAVTGIASLGAGAARAEAPPTENTLTAAERQAGWRLLFDGASTKGWRNYRADTIKPAWQVVDGALVLTGRGGGDIVTDEEFEWFELSLDYRIAPGGNSGLMFRVTEDAPAPWHSGPEVQVLDNVAGKDPQRAGWLYGLYPPAKDRITGEITDATRPAGEWNTISVRVAPEQGEIAVNGIRYTTFKIGSDDWNKKVAASKFAAFPQFGRASRGRICLQDHGDEVAYRNIRIRELRPDAPPPDPVDGTLAVAFEPAFPGLRWEGYEPVDANGRPATFRPVLVTHAGDGSGRIFVVEQHGVIHVIEPAADGARPATSRIFADLRDRVIYSDKQNEEGLLGFAFHPRFADNGECFAYYTSKGHDPSTSVVARLKATPDRSRVEPASAAQAEELLVLPQPFWNHNGGTIVFGPDGMLYVALGDGGAGNDPYGHAQNLGTLFGAILRIDVDRRDAGLAYAIPKDNPFVSTPDARGEIWAYGLRNPWRIAFDRVTGLLWAADVGQGTYEEIDVIVRGGNYGWNVREGRHAFGPRGSGPRADLVEPVFEYDHTVGASITGGHVYRGRRVPELVGRYLYADYVSGKLFALAFDPATGTVTGNHAIPGQKMPVLSWGEDEEGEAYFMIVSNDGQGIYRLVPGK
jgi:glucose/arabinose dehydrogenase